MQTLPWTNGVKDEIGFPVPPRQNSIKSESRWTIAHFKIIELRARLASMLSTIIKKRKTNNKRRIIQKNIVKLYCELLVIISITHFLTFLNLKRLLLIGYISVFAIELFQKDCNN